LRKDEMPSKQPLTIEWLPVDATKPANVDAWERTISNAMGSRGKVVMQYDGSHWTVRSASRRTRQVSEMTTGGDRLEDMRVIVSDELHTAWPILGV
jgi:hypothetical protein